MGLAYADIELINVDDLALVRRNLLDQVFFGSSRR